MTGTDVYYAALALMGSDTSDGSYSDAIVLRNVNTMIPELFGVNNSIRTARGLEKLTAYPNVSALSADLPYEDEITRSVMPYGMAKMLLIGDGDDEMNRAAAFSAQYVNLINQYMRATPVSVTDVYFDTEDDES